MQPAFEMARAEKRQQLWLDAVRLGRTDDVRRMIADGADVSERNNGATVLHLAAENGHADVVKILLDEGADVAGPYRRQGSFLSGSTALHWAAGRGRAEVVKILLDARADVDARKRWGETALHDAARGGHVGVLRILLDAGADLAATSFPNPWGFGDAVLDMAVDECYPLVVRMLLEEGADVAARDANGRSALTRASAKLGTCPLGMLERVRQMVALLEAAEQARRHEANAMAFAMGLQDRLGAASVVRGLDAEVVRMVIMVDAGSCTWFTHREL